MSNTFNSSSGTQNAGIGPNAIGQQENSSSTTGNQSPAIVAGGNVSVSYNSPPPTAPVIPRHLPSLEPCFLHREEELVWLNDRLHPGKVAAVCGPGGMGKSALAAQAVHRLDEGRFPDAIVFHSFYGKPKTETALEAIAGAFQIKPEPTLETAVRQVLAGKQALLILDGAEQADDLKAVLALRSTCGVLITSRKRSDAQGARLDLKPLAEQDAAAVFRQYSGVAADDASVAGICKILGGWPVGLRIAGRYLSSTGESAADYLQWLEQEPFKELAGGQHQEENAALLLRRSVDAVSADARLVLGLAGCLAFAPIAREPVAAILDADERCARAALNELVTYGLLLPSNGRWQISHALVHTYARTELALSKESLERVAGYYISFCKAASAEGAKGYLRLDAERAHCLRLIESCLESKLWQEVKGLAGAIDIYLERQYMWAERSTALEMRLTAARQTGDRKDEGECLGNLGCTYWHIGEQEKLRVYADNVSELLRRQLLWMQETGGFVDIYNTARQVRLQQGKHELHLQYFEQSLSIAREIGDREGEVTTLNNIALLYVTQVYVAQGDYANAIKYREQALAICQQHGDRAGEAESRQNIGVAYYDIGDLAKAEEYISQAVQLAEKIGHPYLEQCRKDLAQVRAMRRGR